MIEHQAPISCVTVSSLGDIATAGYDNKIILWQEYTPLGSVHHDHLVNSCSFDLSGGLLASASSDYSARIWDTSDLRLLAVLNDHTDDVEMASICPSGHFVATACRDHIVRIFNIEGKLVRRIYGHESDVISVCWTKDGDYLFSSSDDGTVKQWNPYNGSLFKTVDLDGIETDTIAVCDDGWVFVGNDLGEIVSIYGNKRNHFKSHRAGIKRLVIDNKKKLMLSSSYDRSLRLWRLEEQGRIQECCSTIMPPLIWPRSADFDNNGNVVMSTFGSTYATFDPNLSTWNLQKVKDTNGINSITVFKDKVYSVGDSGQVKVDNKIVSELQSLCNFIVVWIDQLVFGGQLGILFNLKGDILYQHHSPLNCATVLENNDLLIGTYTGEGIQLGLTDKNIPVVRKIHKLHEQAVKGIANYNQIIFSVSASGDASIIDTRLTYKTINLENAHNQIANGVCLIPDGRFATVSRDRVLRIWNKLNPKCIPTPHKHSVKCVSISSCGKFIVTGSYDGTIAFYEFDKNDWKIMVRPTTSGISCLCPSMGTSSVLASSYDGFLYYIESTGKFSHYQ